MGASIVVSSVLAVPMTASPATADDGCPWSGSVTLSASATSYTTNGTEPTVTAWTTGGLGYLTCGATLGVYDDTGHLVCWQGAYGTGCNGPAPAPINGTRVYTAYVINGNPPTSGPPAGALATSAPVTISNVGYVNQSLTLTASAASYTTNDSTPTVTATASPYLTGGYQLSVYDELGHRVCTQATYGTGCSGDAPAPMNGTHVYTAYVAYGNPPTTGPPTNDVRATSASVTIHNLGYLNHSIQLTSTALSFTTNDSPPTLTAQVDPYLTGGYQLSVYDDAGHLVCSQGSYGTACSGDANVPLNGTRVYKAYVAYGNPPTTGPPTNDVRAVSGPVTVKNLGYVNQSISLTASATSYGPGDPTPTVTATVSPSLSGGYELSIYDENGQLMCTQTTYGTSCSASAPAPADGSIGYTAYVAYGAPPTAGPPTNDVRAISNDVIIRHPSAASLHVTVNNWDSGTDPSNTAYSFTVTGSALATGAGPCRTTGCTWTLTITYTDTDGVVHTVTLGTGNVSAGQDNFSTIVSGVIDLSAAVGDPYVTVQLTPNGSSSPTLMSGGAGAGALSKLILDGIDVDAEFAKIAANYALDTSANPCNTLLFVGGTHTQKTSPTDQFDDCDVATGGGATQLTYDALKTLVKKYGPWIAIALGGAVAATADVTHPSTDPSQVTIDPAQSNVDRVAQLMLAQSVGKVATLADAKVLARQCLQSLAETGGALAQPDKASCQAAPVFFPGSDNPDTTANDYRGIFSDDRADGQAHLEFLQLTRSAALVSEGWYNTFSSREAWTNPCLGPHSGQSCDEYPFRSTSQAGGESAMLALVPPSQNSSEGSRLRWFYAKCGVVLDSPFLVVPMTGATAPPTTYTCGSPGS